MTGTTSISQHAWWLASRASGLVALALVTLAVGIGLALSARLMPPGLARRLAAVHEQAALAGLVAIAVHGLTLLGDPWLHPGPTGIAVPFVGGYRPLWTGFGIAAGWLAVLLGLSFYVRRWIGARLWRRTHRATVVVYLLSLAHTIGAGTDAGSAWLRGAMIGTAVPMGVLFLARVVPRRRKPAPASRSRRPARPAVQGGT